MLIDENLKEALSRFDSISLSEMEDVKLMDRTDTKYIFFQDELAGYLQEIAANYRILEINGKRVSKYETLYFDSPDFMLYHQHHQGKSSRYKVRHRIYADSGTHFLEIKFKTNKGRTIKNRIKKDSVTTDMSQPDQAFITRYSTLDPLNLVPKLWTNYSRITLVNRYSKERLTLDLDLQFKNDLTEKRIPSIAIVEVKQEKYAPSPFLTLMKEKGIRQGSISKYCYGVIYLNEQIKQNNFKKYLLTINKINRHAPHA